jgi:hypothetical protein
MKYKMKSRTASNVALLVAIVIGFIGGLYLPNNVSFIGPIIVAIVGVTIHQLGSR